MNAWIITGLIVLIFKIVTKIIALCTGGESFDVEVSRLELGTWLIIQLMYTFWGIIAFFGGW